MKNIRFFLLSSCILDIFQLSAQEVALDVIEGGVINLQGYGGVMIGKELPPSNVKGSPYLFDDFQSGELLLTSNKTIRGIDWNYDLFNDVIIIKNKKGDLYSLTSALMKEINAGDRQFKNTNISGIGIVEFIFECNNYDFLLLKRHWLLKKDPSYIEGLDFGSRDYELIRKYDLFGLVSSNSYELKSRKDLLAAFNEYPELKQRMKEKKVSPRDLEKLLNFLRTNC
ncbi:MAG: hypothetical protein AAGF85_16355 [Bacteroidota bacterium]